MPRKESDWPQETQEAARAYLVDPASGAWVPNGGDGRLPAIAKGLRERAVTGEALVAAAMASVRNAVTITATKNCNMACTYCYRSVSKLERWQDSLRTEDVAAILGRVKERSVASRLRVVQFTGGEVFLRPDMLDWIQLAVDLGFKVRLSTNATLERMKRPESIAVLRHPMVELRVSVDGATAETHELYRDKGSFARMTGVTRFLLDAGVRVSSKTVFHAGNIDEFDALFDFCRQAGFTAFTYNTLSDLGFSKTHGLSRIDDEVVARRVWMRVRGKPELQHWLRASPFARNLLKTFDLSAFHLPKFYHHVDHDGTVYPADALTAPPYALGNVLRDGLDGPLALEPIERYYRDYAAFHPACAGCPIQPLCPQGRFGESAPSEAAGRTGEDPFVNCDALRRQAYFLMSLGAEGLAMAKLILAGKPS